MTLALITGASGFVGSNLARRLSNDGWEVRCLVRPTSRTGPLESLGVELGRGSLDDAASLADAVRGVDVVFHLAGRVAACRNEDFFRDNVEGTRAVAQAATSSRRRRRRWSSSARWRRAARGRSSTRAARSDAESPAVGLRPQQAGRGARRR